MEESKVAALLEQAKHLPQLLAQLRAGGATSIQLAAAMKSFLCRRARVQGIPISGQFELTPLCNLDCRMCYVHLNAAQLQGKTPLSAETWESLMSQAIRRGMLYATLTGGECLTYPDFDRLYLFLHRAGVQISILTNGVLLTPERIHFFQAHPPAFLQVTIYGSQEDAYERVTGHRVCQRVLENLRRANEAKLPVMITLTPNRYAGDDNWRLLEQVASLGLRFEINSSLIVPREETGRTLEEAEISYQEYFRLLKRRMELTGAAVPEECYAPLPEPGRTGTDAPIGLRCGGGRSSFAINWRGELMPCSSLEKLSEDALSLGFDQAWHRVQDAALHYLLPCECQGCAYQSVAYSCVAAHQPDAEPGHASPHMCQWCQELVRSGLRDLT